MNRFGDRHPIRTAAAAASVLLVFRLLFAVIEDRGVLDTVWLVVSSAAIYMAGFTIVVLLSRQLRANRNSGEADST